MQNRRTHYNIMTWDGVSLNMRWIILLVSSLLRIKKLEFERKKEKNLTLRTTYTYQQCIRQCPYKPNLVTIGKAPDIFHIPTSAHSILSICPLNSRLGLSIHQSGKQDSINIFFCPIKSFVRTKSKNLMCRLTFSASIVGFVWCL